MRELAGDLRGGVSSAVVGLGILLPLGLLSFASFGPDGGSLGVRAAFVAAIVGGAVAAAVGGSVIPGSGPRTSTTLIFAGFVAVLAADPRLRGANGLDVESILILTSLCVALAGALQIAFALLRLGSIVSFVPAARRRRLHGRRRRPHHRRADPDPLRALRVFVDSRRARQPAGDGARGRPRLGGGCVGRRAAHGPGTVGACRPRVRDRVVLGHRCVRRVGNSAAGRTCVRLAVAVARAVPPRTERDRDPFDAFAAIADDGVRHRPDCISRRAPVGRRRRRETPHPPQAQSRAARSGAGQRRVGRVRRAAGGAVPDCPSRLVSSRRSNPCIRYRGRVRAVAYRDRGQSDHRHRARCGHRRRDGDRRPRGLRPVEPHRLAGTSRRQPRPGRPVVAGHGAHRVRRHRILRLPAGNRRRFRAVGDPLRRLREPIARAQRGHGRNPGIAADLPARPGRPVARTRCPDSPGRDRRGDFLRHGAQVRAGNGSGGTGHPLPDPRSAPSDDDRRFRRARLRSHRLARTFPRDAARTCSAGGGRSPRARAASARCIRADRGPALVSRCRPRARVCRASPARRGGTASALRRAAAREAVAFRRHRAAATRRSSAPTSRASSSPPRKFCSAAASPAIACTFSPRVP